MKQTSSSQTTATSSIRFNKLFSHNIIRNLARTKCLLIACAVSDKAPLVPSRRGMLNRRLKYMNPGLHFSIAFRLRLATHTKVTESSCRPAQTMMTALSDTQGPHSHAKTSLALKCNTAQTNTQRPLKAGGLQGPPWSLTYSKMLAI